MRSWRLVLICVLLSPATRAVPREVTFREGVSPTSDYSGTRDLTITSEGPLADSDPNATYDQTSLLVAGFTTQQFSLLRFDVSALPPGTGVESVRLVVRVNEAAPKAYGVYELLLPWSSSSVTWNRAAPGVPWSQPGALGVGTDRSAAQLGVLHSTTTGGHPILLNAEGVASVQRWVDVPAGNFGLIIADGYISDGLTLVSSEGALASRPRLEVTHSGGTVTNFQNGSFPSAAYAGAQDAFIASSRFDAGSLNGSGLWVTTVSSCLLRFELSSVPAQAQVLSAELLLEVGSKGGARTPYEVLVPWTEAATWTTYDGVSPWTTPGALDVGSDYEPTVLANFGTTMPATGPYVFPLNDAGVAVVQAWVAGTRPNHGFVVPSALTTGTSFHDREDPVPAFRPGLRLIYEDGTDGGEAPDAGLDPDGGAPGLQRYSVGCDCGQVGGAAWGLLLLPLLVALRGRRRRAASSYRVSSRIAAR